MKLQFFSKMQEFDENQAQKNAESKQEESKKWQDLRGMASQKKIAADSAGWVQDQSDLRCCSGLR